MKRRKRIMPKRSFDERKKPVTANESTPSNQIVLPGFDFSKRSHQAVFWMLLNTVIYENPRNSARKAYRGI
ncbi:MAG TPA: hypothetical protein VNB22_11005 [Pyrinomonadaceae bacterium]|jgi:hypothetical protein|nr:hypothetical protein [Pyrinomonadaceae bacterium]